MVGRGTSPVRFRNRWEDRNEEKERDWGKLKPIALRSPSPPSNYIQRDITVRRERATERLGLAFNDGMIETKITEVWNGPCKDAGVASGMVIVAVDGQGTQTLSLLQRYLADAGLVFTLSVEESIPTGSSTATSSRPLSPINSLPVTPAGLPRSIASYPPPSASTPAIAAAPLSHHKPEVTTTSLVVAPQDEVIQLRLQLEAAEVQIRSTQARLQTQTEIEQERNEELVVEREKRQKLNTELILERTAKNEAEEEVRILREQLRQSRERQLAQTGDERHDKLRRGQLEEEILILRNELQSLKQLLFQQSSGNRERELLLRCFDDERAEWNFIKHDLEQQLADALVKCESMQHLKSEVEALTAAMQSPAPIHRSKNMAPIMSEITYSAKPEPPVSVASIPFDEPVPLSVHKPIHRDNRGLLLSERVRADGADEPVSPRSRTPVSPQKPYPSTTTTYESYSRDRTSRKADKMPSDLDDRLEEIASRARDAIAAAEQRAIAAEQQASGLKDRIARMKTSHSDADKLREAENRALRLQLDKEQTQLQKDRQDILDKEKARRELEHKTRQDQQRLERERNDQEKRWQEAERKAQDLEKRIASASASVAASAKSGSPTSTVDEIGDLTKRAAAVFRVICLKAGRADTRTIPKQNIPDVLGCGDSWKVLFRGLHPNDEGLVTSDIWINWITALAEQSGVAESESRLEWVEEQLAKSRASSPVSVSSFRGQTTRELQAEAKALDRLNPKKPTNKYADWGYKPSTTL